MSKANNNYSDASLKGNSGSIELDEFTYLKNRFSDSVQSVKIFRGDAVINIEHSIIRDAIKALKDDFRPSYNYLSYITAEHWIEPAAPDGIIPPVFQVIYGLQALPSPATRLRLVITVKDKVEVSIPSISDIFPGANWHEREIFDLFGISFTGHPNLTRILTPETYTEHPLRRDFPHGGYDLMEFQDRLIAQWNVTEERDYLGKFGDPWIAKILEQQTGRISLTRISQNLSIQGNNVLPGKIAEEEQK